MTPEGPMVVGSSLWGTGPWEIMPWRELYRCEFFVSYSRNHHSHPSACWGYVRRNEDALLEVHCKIDERAAVPGSLVSTFSDLDAESVVPTTRGEWRASHLADPRFCPSWGPAESLEEAQELCDAALLDMGLVIPGKEAVRVARELRSFSVGSEVFLHPFDVPATIVDRARSGTRLWVLIGGRECSLGADGMAFEEPRAGVIRPPSWRFP